MGRGQGPVSPKGGFGRIKKRRRAKRKRTAEEESNWHGKDATNTSASATPTSGPATASELASRGDRFLAQSQLKPALSSYTSALALYIAHLKTLDSDARAEAGTTEIERLMGKAEQIKLQLQSQRASRPDANAGANTPHDGPAYPDKRKKRKKAQPM